MAYGVQYEYEKTENDAHKVASAKISPRIDLETKERAQKQLAQHGLTMSEFMRVMVTTIANQGLPRYYGFPNEQVIKSVNEVKDDLAGTKPLEGADGKATLEKLLNE